MTLVDSKYMINKIKQEYDKFMKYLLYSGINTDFITF